MRWKTASDGKKGWNWVVGVSRGWMKYSKMRNCCSDSVCIYILRMNQHSDGTMFALGRFHQINLRWAGEFLFLSFLVCSLELQAPSVRQIFGSRLLIARTWCDFLSHHSTWRQIDGLFCLDKAARVSVSSFRKYFANDSCNVNKDKGCGETQDICCFVAFLRDS